MLVDSPHRGGGDKKVNTIMPLLNEIHAELAKSNLPAEQYQLISAMMIDVKQLVKPTILPHTT